MPYIIIEGEEYAPFVLPQESIDQGFFYRYGINNDGNLYQIRYNRHADGFWRRDQQDDPRPARPELDNIAIHPPHGNPDFNAQFNQQQAVDFEAVMKGIYDKAEQEVNDMKTKEAPMSAKSDKPKKSKKKIEFTPEELKECRERESIYKAKFDQSIPTDWESYEGLGWLHAQEVDKFCNDYGECKITKQWFFRRNLYRIFTGGLISEKGIKEGGYVRCHHSEHFCKPDDLIEVHVGNVKRKIHSSYIDNGEYFKCEISKKFFHRNERIRIQDSVKWGGFVSKTEASKEDSGVKRCECCGVWFDAERVLQRIWDRGRTMACNPCNNKELGKNLIRPHNFAEYPMPIYKKREYWRMTGETDKRRRKKMEDVGIRLFGVEVETELNKRGCAAKGLDRFSMARAMKDALGDDFVMVKEDGSLSMNGHYQQSVYAGFEVVSAPADIEVHRQRWGKLLEMENFKQLRAWDTETCGMHVHVSKAALTTLQIGRILMFMTHNDNKKFIAKVAGRGENKYCRAHHKEKLSDGIQYGEVEVRDGVEYIQADFHLPRNDEARRQAVNITNPKTIEFRIFRGTVHPRHIIRNIEFCDAVCSYCHPGSRSFLELRDWRPFIKYCADNRKTYPLFVEWCESEDVGLLPKRNAYGEKDTRGNKKPEVIESVAEPIKKPSKEDIMDDAMAFNVPMRAMGEAPVRPVRLRRANIAVYGEICGEIRYDPGVAVPARVPLVQIRPNVPDVEEDHDDDDGN